MKNKNQLYFFWYVYIDPYTNKERVIKWSKICRYPTKTKAYKDCKYSFSHGVINSFGYKAQNYFCISLNDIMI